MPRLRWPALKVLFTSNYTQGQARMPRTPRPRPGFLGKAVRRADLAPKVREVLDTPPV